MPVSAVVLRTDSGSPDQEFGSLQTGELSKNIRHFQRLPFGFATTELATGKSTVAHTGPDANAA